MQQYVNCQALGSGTGILDENCLAGMILLSKVGTSPVEEMCFVTTININMP